MGSPFDLPEENNLIADAYAPGGVLAGTGGIAPPQPQGGLLRRFADRLEGGIQSVTGHPLYSRLWSGGVSGMAGDPMAGPNALRDLRKPPSLQDEINAYRLKAMVRGEEEAAEKSTLAKSRRADESQLSELLAAGDTAGAREVASRLFPQAAATPLFAAPPKFAPIPQSIGGEMWQDFYPLGDGSGPDPEKPYGKPYRKRNPPQPGWFVNSSLDANGNPIVQAGAGISPAQMKDAVAKRVSAGAILGNSEQLYDILQEAPGVAGVFGKFGKSAAGVAGAAESTGLLPKGSGEAVAGFTTGGATQDQLTKYTAVSGALKARAKLIVSSDTGSVMSNQDAVRLDDITSVDTWMTNDVQAMAAIRTVSEIALKVEVGNAVIQGLQSPYDPRTEKGAEALERQLRRIGSEDADIERVFTELLTNLSDYETTQPLRQPPRMPGSRRREGFSAGGTTP